MIKHKIKEITYENEEIFKKYLEKIEKEYIRRFEAIVISPLICGDANTRLDSIIRATEIKGILRWFLRYILLDSDKNTIVEILDEIFGGTSQSSFFDISIKINELNYDRLNLSENEYGKRIVFALRKRFIRPESRFTIEFIKKRQLESTILKGKEEDLIKLFKIIINIVGFGHGIRTGLGKVYLFNQQENKNSSDLSNNKKYISLDNLFEDLKSTINKLFGSVLHNKFDYHKIKELDVLIDKIKYYLSNEEINNMPSILVWEIEDINETSDSYLKALKEIYKFKNNFYKEFNIKFRIDLKKIIKSKKTGSPIVFSILKNENKLTIYGIVLLKELKIYYNTHKKS